MSSPQQLQVIVFTTCILTKTESKFLIKTYPPQKILKNIACFSTSNSITVNNKFVYSIIINKILFCKFE